RALFRQKVTLIAASGASEYRRRRKITGGYFSNVLDQGRPHPEGLAHRFVVIDEEYKWRYFGVFAVDLLASSSTRQSDAKGSAMRSHGGYRQRSAMSFDDQPANCHTHPHASGLCREERVKDMVDVFLLYAGAGIFDRNLQAVRVEWL